MSLSIETLLAESQSELESIDNQLNNAFIAISKHSLLADKQLLHHFETKIGDEWTTTTTTSLSHLNQQYEEIESNLHDLRQLELHYSQYQEIDLLINKGPQLNILDFQQLFILFDKYYKQQGHIQQEDVILIYKVIHKSIDHLHEQFVGILNDYLLTFMPNEFSIENIHGLHEFNKLLSSHSIKLDNYLKYRNRWDDLIEVLLSSKSSDQDQLVLDDKNLDIDFIAMKLEKATTSPNFIKSTSNLITFINYVDNESIKQYLNSKINKLLINKIAININSIITDSTLLSSLNELIELNRATNGWNIFIGAFNDHESDVQGNLTKLYNDWLIDQYIDKLRKTFRDQQLIKQLVNAPQSESGLTATGDPATATATTTNDDDGWNDSWNNDDDDGWDDEDVLKDETIAMSNETKDSNVINKVSKLSNEIIQLVQQFQKDSSDADIKYLISTIKSLSLIKYSSIDESLLIYNDLNHLGTQLKSPELSSFGESIWNQNLLNIYQQLKLVLMSLRFGGDGIDDQSRPDSDEDEDELDDYNLNQLSLIYSIFNKIFNDSDYQLINSTICDQLIIEIVDFINNYLISKLLSLDAISEFQSIKISKIIDSINNITVPFLKQKQKDEIKSYNKLDNFKFLIKNHLSDILDRFNEGEFFDLSTDELIIMIKKLFIQSRLRDDCINEIVEFRNLT